MHKNIHALSFLEFLCLEIEELGNILKAAFSKTDTGLVIFLLQ